ncbi:Txe/YoeB family addiction module toxin [Williamsia sp.]|uniref:Txe/YoeB family addiction module toxin n=1 Tax=Williamsia sp. TaxID=1872085 RepID=UPI002F920B7A
MNVAFTDDGWADFTHWAVKDRARLKRILALIKDMQRDPHTGIGKPERLKHVSGTVYSRRIDQEHRLVYVVLDDGTLVIQQARYRY